MKKPTTVEGWLKTLPEPLRSEAFDRAYRWIMGIKSNSLSDAIGWLYYGREQGSYEFWNSFLMFF